jgi:hypothetical protein
MAIKIPIVEAQRPAIHLIISTISTLVKNKMVLESRLDFISELTNSKVLRFPVLLIYFLCSLYINISEILIA